MPRRVYRNSSSQNFRNRKLYPMQQSSYYHYMNRSKIMIMHIDGSDVLWSNAILYLNMNLLLLAILFPIYFITPTLNIKGNGLEKHKRHNVKPLRHSIDSSFQQRKATVSEYYIRERLLRSRYIENNLRT